jgi:hypothetical protein
VPNRRLTDEERDHLLPLLNDVRERLRVLAGDDAELLWALRRKLYKELMYDERGKPMQRRALKTFKRKEQEAAAPSARANSPTRTWSSIDSKP